jgi:hypothetical protein
MSETTNQQQNVRYDSASTADTGDDRHTIATYLGDMLALERHMKAPVDAQTGDDDHARYGEAATLVARMRTLIDAHESALQSRIESIGGTGGAGIKSAWSQLVGGAAAAVNSSRKTKVSKRLRDDYTALALASISYTMLHTTALGLGDETTAALAKRGLDDYAPLVVDIGRALPQIVLQELADDGENVRVSAAQLAEQNTTDSWKRNS